MARTRSILIAEDDSTLRAVYLRRFAHTPYAVRTAGDGEEAVRMMHELVPDLLICDIVMPVRDGWWILSQLPPDRPFPVLMLSNLEDAETRQWCRDAGVDAFLVKKDTSLRTLVETAERLLAKRSRG